jgi:hypothetical protein
VPGGEGGESLEAWRLAILVEHLLQAEATFDSFPGAGYAGESIGPRIPHVDERAHELLAPPVSVKEKKIPVVLVQESMELLQASRVQHRVLRFLSTFLILPAGAGRESMMCRRATVRSV